MRGTMEGVNQANSTRPDQSYDQRRKDTEDQREYQQRRQSYGLRFKISHPVAPQFGSHGAQSFTQRGAGLQRLRQDARHTSDRFDSRFLAEVGECLTAIRQYPEFVEQARKGHGDRPIGVPHFRGYLLQRALEPQTSLSAHNQQVKSIGQSAAKRRRVRTP